MCDQHSTENVWTPGTGLIGIDPCIANLVKALNEAGCRTVASCCGHGHRPGNIVLADGREIIIAPDHGTARAIDRAFPISAYGEVVEHEEPYCAAESWHPEPYLCTRPKGHSGDHGCVFVDWPNGVLTDD